MKKISAKALGESLRKIIKHYGYDGIEIPATIVDGLKVEYIQYQEDGVFLSDAEGSDFRPFDSISTEEATDLYDKALIALAE